MCVHICVCVCSYTVKFLLLPRFWFQGCGSGAPLWISLCNRYELTQDKPLYWVGAEVQWRGVCYGFSTPMPSQHNSLMQIQHSTKGGLQHPALHKGDTVKCTWCFAGGILVPLTVIEAKISPVKEGLLAWLCWHTGKQESTGPQQHRASDLSGPKLGPQVLWSLGQHPFFKMVSVTVWRKDLLFVCMFSFLFSFGARH